MATRLGPLRPIIDDALRVEVGTLRADLLDAVLRGENVLLTGPAGSGKTTALTQLAADLHDHHHPAVIVRGQLARSVEDLIALIWDALPVPSREGSGLNNPVRTAEQWEKMAAGGPKTAVVNLGRQIESLRRPSPVTILLDDLTDAELADTLFARARDLLWDLGHQWVLAARPAQQALLTRPPAGAFWGSRIQMPAPTKNEWDELLAHRGLSPKRDIQAKDTLRDVIARAAAPSGGPGPSPPTPTTSELPAPQWKLLDAMRALGRPVTADDDELLARVSWSRPYTSSLLRELVELGLLTTESEQRSTPGRPRKLYIMTPIPGSR